MTKKHTFDFDQKSATRKYSIQPPIFPTNSLLKRVHEQLTKFETLHQTHYVDISVLITLRCLHDVVLYFIHFTNWLHVKIWAPSSEFVSSSIPSWQILTAHVQTFRGARDLAFCLKVPLDSLLVWASSEGSGETARMRRLARTFAARIGDKYQIRLARPIYNCV